MSTIKILPEILSNQIAAGEVVERPVSIVKELIENSLDAGSSNITVEIVNGGKSLIRVSDDGVGLSRDDALLAIERYATSKIYVKEDLFSISTMGFRGEALPSIASVSKFTLVTRTQNDDIGTRVEMAGGKILNVSDTGAPVGTMVEVKSLFYNTPARKKFLKSEQTESSHIKDAIYGMALGHDQVLFRLFVNQKLQKHFSLSDDLYQRTVQVIGKEAIDKLYPLDFEDSVLKIKGYCSNPSITRSTSSKIFLFVNQRLIHDRGLISAIFRGYRGRIMKGRFPVGVFFIDIAYDQVDVNVHPSKKEIKFFNSQRVYSAMARAIEEAFEREQKTLSTYAQVGYEEKVKTVSSFEHMNPEDDPNQKDRLVQTRISWPKPEKLKDAVSESVWNQFPEESLKKANPKNESIETKRDNILKEDVERDQKQSPDQHQKGVDKRGDDDGLKVIGQILGTYILVEADDGLVMVDQHAAHERIVYEKLKKRYESLEMQSQMLALPETLECSYKEADILKMMLPQLSNLGLVIEPFGGTTFVVKSIPLLLENHDMNTLIKDMIDASESKLGSKGDLVNPWVDDCLILMACHSAIRAKKMLNQVQMQKLIDDLELCENSRHCPHGRPIQLFWSKYQIQKLFKRIV